MLKTDAFSLLRGVMQKMMLPFASVEERELEPRMRAALSEVLPTEVPPRLSSLPLSPCVRYHLTDPFGFRYIYFRLPEVGAGRVLLIGPYLSAPITAERLPEYGEAVGIPPEALNGFLRYCETLCVLPTGDRFFLLLDAFCEELWQNSFSVTHLDTAEWLPTALSVRADENADNILLQMRAMEKRYRFENEMILAVANGQMYRREQLFSALSLTRFEQRLADPVRNAKNYCIIMNTLLRKAAEQGGVHPFHLDRVSSEFAAGIETMRSFSETQALMHRMFCVYCELVQEHHVGQYSSVVKQAVLLITADLSRPLSLSRLAEELQISAGYLATVFKKETGSTVSAYVRDRRMRYAAHLLTTTSLQVQTVALHCGMEDVQYFSKCFKRTYGKTPGEYREAGGGRV